MNILGQYPQRRMRRNRDGAAIRQMLQETHLGAEHFIWPIFICEGEGQKAPILSMPGIFRHSLDGLPWLVEQAKAHGIQAMAIFPYIEEAYKSKDCRQAYNPDNLVCRAVRTLRKLAPNMMIMCDVALDPFNIDGHDGLYIEPQGSDKEGRILNDEAIELLLKQALVQAEAGADCLGPSDMMDGRIGKIRNELDKQGFDRVRLISYAAKYASKFYGPFREAVGSGGLLQGDKASYQMNPANKDEALHEVALDLQEGADIVMIKPGMPYLDIIYAVKQKFNVPVAAYQVSGEYSMQALVIQQNILDEQVILESLLCFRRAGANAILTYFAPKAAELLNRVKG